MSVVTGIGVFLFFALIQPYQLRSQEMYQMFLFTSDYFRSVVCLPGGLADYAGRFLTQFMLYPWIGALIVCLLFTSVQQLTFTHIVRRDMLAYTVSFVPAVLLTVSFCNKDTLLSVFVAAVTGLAAAICIRFSKRLAVFEIAASVVLYFLSGSLGVVFFIGACHAHHRRVLPTLCGLAAILASVIVSRYIFNFQFVRLLCGIHYSRYHDTVPLLPWLAAASAVALPLFMKNDRTAGPAWSTAAVLVVSVGLFAGMFANRNAEWEEIFRYSTLAGESQWNKILRSALRRNPSTEISLSCLNLALAETGQLGNCMFQFRQNGQNGLFYPYRREHISPIPASVVYWNLGFMNTCQRFTFAAEEVIPDYQKSSWCHRRLAEVFLVKGQYDVARKYLEPLKYTLFYRSWAVETEKLLDNPEQIDSHTVYGEKRRCDLKEHRSLYSSQDMYTPLYQYCQENPGNMVLRQYLLGLCLLNADMDRFVGFLQPELFREMPVSYQEAYILYWSRDHDSAYGIPSFVSERTVNNFMSFTTAAMSMSEASLQQRYSHTYWYYFINYDDRQN